MKQRKYLSAWKMFIHFFDDIVQVRIHLLDRLLKIISIPLDDEPNNRICRISIAKIIFPKDASSFVNGQVIAADASWLAY